MLFSVWGYADGDDSPNGQIPAVSYRESVTSARDYANLFASALLPSPQAANEVLGIVHQSDEPFLNDGVMVLLRGHQLIPQYVNPADMTAVRWAQLSELMAWGRRNAAALAPTVPILPQSWRSQDGTPEPPTLWPIVNPSSLLPREVYGYAHLDSSGKSPTVLIGLRNPWIAEAVREVTIDAMLGVTGGCPWEDGSIAIVSLYPEQRVYATGLSCGSNVSVHLAPYETVVLFCADDLQSGPLNSLPTAGSALAPTVSVVSAVQSSVRRVIYPAHHAEAPRMGLNWLLADGAVCPGTVPLTPCSVDTQPTVGLHANLSVVVSSQPSSHTVQLVVFVESTSAIGPFVSVATRGGELLHVSDNSSTAGFTATGQATPLFWRVLTATLPPASVNLVGNSTVHLDISSDRAENVTRVSAWLWESRQAALQPPRSTPFDALPAPESVSLSSIGLFDVRVSSSTPSEPAPHRKPRRPTTIVGAYLDALQPTTDQQGFGPNLKHTTNMRIDALGRLSLMNRSAVVTFGRGLGVCPGFAGSPSRMVYQLGGGFTAFQAMVGLDTAGDREISLGPAVQFAVVVENLTKYQSPVMHVNDVPQEISVPVVGARLLELVVTTQRVDKSNAGDYSDWVHARLLSDHLAEPVSLGALSQPGPGAGRGKYGFALSLRQAFVVNSIGRMCVEGNERNHTLRITRAADSHELQQVTVAVAGCEVGLIVHSPVQPPILLSGGSSSYFITSDEAAGEDQWHVAAGTRLALSEAAVQAGAEVTGSVVYQAGRWEHDKQRPSASFGPLDLQFAVATQD